MDIQTNSWVFQDTTTTGNGNVFKSGRNDQLTIYISGDSTSREVHIEGCDSDDNWYSVPALKLPEMTIASVVTENNTAYSINLANYVGIRCRVSAINGGTVRITGRVVDMGASLITNNPNDYATDTKQDEIINAIRNITEASVDTGVATNGTIDSITDNTKDWPIDGFTNLVVEITDGAGKGQIRRIISNMANELIVSPNFNIVPNDTSQYRIAFFGKMASDITHIGGTAQTGRDWSEDLAKLDVALSTLATKVNQESIAGYIDQIEGYVDGLEAAMGTTADEEVIGNGSLISITKRLRSLLNGGLPATLSSGGGVKVGVVDSLPAGTNNIGKVDVNSSALPTGASTSAKQDNIISYVDEIESGLTTLNAKDFATQATLSEILTKLADPATQATLAQIKSILDTDGIKKIIGPLPVGSNLIGKIDVNSSALPSGAAQETTLEAVRAALVAGGLPSSTLETTHHDASTANGTGTVANVSGYGPIAFQAVGTWDGATVTYQGSVDGTNYVALPGTSAVTADGIFQPVDPGVAGYKSVRAEITNAGATTSLTVKSLAIAVAKPTSADVVAVGKNAEGASVTGNPLTIGYKNASGNATGVTPTNALPVQLSGSFPANAVPFTVTGDSGANAAQTITKAAEAGKSHYITAIEVVLTGATSASAISVKLNDDATTIWKSAIGLGSARGTRTGIALPFPIKITTGKKVDLVVDAGGASTVTYANMSGYTL